MKRTKKIPLLLIGLLVIFYVLTELYTIYLYKVSDTLEIKKGTIEYYLLIPGVIRDIPIVGPCSNLMFTHCGNSDFYEEYQAVSYVTKVSVRVMRNIILEYLGRSGYSTDTTNISGPLFSSYLFQNSKNEILINLRDNGDTEVMARIRPR